MLCHITLGASTAMCYSAGASGQARRRSEEWTLQQRIWQCRKRSGSPRYIVLPCSIAAPSFRHEGERDPCPWCLQNTSELVREALQHVKANHPHWEKHNGGNHFMVFSYDHARCDMALNLQLSEMGQMFSIQSYGDLTLT